MAAQAEKILEAASLRDIDAVKLLLSSGVDVNRKHGMNGWTALHWAARRADGRIVAALLEAGADASSKNAKGETAADLSSSAEVRRLLGASSALPPPQPSSSTIGFEPNYLRNPTVHDRDYYVPSSSFPCVPRTTHDAPGAERVLVLKVRTEGEEDFIEVDLSMDRMTLEGLEDLVSAELRVPKEEIGHLRKLPNTRLRRDRDVERLQELQEIEAVRRAPPVTPRQL